MSTTFRSLLEEAVAKYGSQSAAADAIGMDRTRFGRVLLSIQRIEAATSGKFETVVGEPPTPPSFEVVNCLRLARALGRSPSEVLKAAGKSEEAALIEEMYGPAHALVLTADEERVLRLLRAERDLGERVGIVDTLKEYTRIVGAISNVIVDVVQRRAKADEERSLRETEEAEVRFYSRQQRLLIERLKPLTAPVSRSRHRDTSRSFLLDRVEIDEVIPQWREKRGPF